MTKHFDFEHGPQIGTYDETPIFEWILGHQDEKCFYIGITDWDPDFGDFLGTHLVLLPDGDFLQHPGILYRANPISLER